MRRRNRCEAKANATGGTYSHLYPSVPADRRHIRKLRPVQYFARATKNRRTSWKLEPSVSEQGTHHCGTHFTCVDTSARLFQMGNRRPQGCGRVSVVHHETNRALQRGTFSGSVSSRFDFLSTNTRCLSHRRCLHMGRVVQESHLPTSRCPHLHGDTDARFLRNGGPNALCSGKSDTSLPLCQRFPARPGRSGRFRTSRGGRLHRTGIVRTFTPATP